MTRQLPTKFAPAEVAPRAEVLRDAAQLAQNTFTKYLIDSIPDTFLILNEQRQVVLANEAFVKLLNDEPEHILGKRPGDLLGCEHSSEGVNSCGTTEYCRQCGAVKAILAGLDGKAETQECRIVQKAGDGLNLRVWARPLRIEDRQFVIFTVRDTRDEQRRKALERIFFHDILNTAGIVSTYAQILEIDPEEIYSVRTHLNGVTDRLINEIIAQRDLMRAENGELEVRFQAINAQALVEQLAEQYRSHPVSEERHIAVRADQAVQFVTDEPLLGRVVGNMLKNALEASDKGAIVTVGCDHNATHVRFFVHNNAFIPRKVQLQIFQRSFSTKGAGRGLGTYSMRLLSERYLNGTVSFISTKERGTTFFAEYPLESSPGN